MRNNNLIQRQKRHAQAYMRLFAQKERPCVASIVTVKALHHVQMAHLAWRARHEFKRRPREAQ